MVHSPHKLQRHHRLHIKCRGITDLAAFGYLVIHSIKTSSDHNIIILISDNTPVGET